MVLKTRVEGLLLIESDVYRDEWVLFEHYSVKHEALGLIGDRPDNCSLSQRGRSVAFTIRSTPAEQTDQRSAWKGP